MPFITIPVESRFGITIRNTLITKEGSSRKLMAILPGQGYTANAPLLRYMRQMGLASGYDALLTYYGFQLTQKDLHPNDLPHIYEDSANAIAAALKRGYREICVVGKSLGTPIAASIVEEIQIDKKSLILLTPIRDAAESVRSARTLAIIGTADPRYDPDKIQSSELVTWRVYEGLDHSLEYPGNWPDSIAILREIIRTCAAFISETNI